MKALCRVCDLWPATYRARTTEEPRVGSWLVCGTCILRAPEGPAYEFELLPEEVA